MSRNILIRYLIVLEKWNEMKFPRLPTIQFLTTYSMQKVNKRKVWESNEASMHACVFVLKVGSYRQFNSCTNDQFAITFASNMASVCSVFFRVFRGGKFPLPKQ